MKNLSETSFKVKIFHDEKVHQPQCQMESQVKERTDPCCRFSRVSLCNRSNRHMTLYITKYLFHDISMLDNYSQQMPQVRCPRLREVHDGGTVKVIYGEKSIYSHLQMLNSDVRRKAQVKYILHNYV